MCTAYCKLKTHSLIYRLMINPCTHIHRSAEFKSMCLSSYFACFPAFILAELLLLFLVRPPSLHPLLLTVSLPLSLSSLPLFVPLLCSFSSSNEMTSLQCSSTQWQSLCSQLVVESPALCLSSEIRALFVYTNNKWDKLLQGQKCSHQKHCSM